MANSRIYFISSHMILERSHYNISSITIHAILSCFLNMFEFQSFGLDLFWLGLHFMHAWNIFTVSLKLGLRVTGRSLHRLVRRISTDPDKPRSVLSRPRPHVFILSSEYQPQTIRDWPHEALGSLKIPDMVGHYSAIKNQLTYNIYLNK